MFRIVLTLIVILLAALSAARAATRIALVVGNADYEHAPDLATPKNDSTDMTALLKSLDFQVIGGADLDSKSMAEALTRFGDTAAAADVALFFYAGHGLQVNGQNYMVPVDSRVRYETAGDTSLVSLSDVMRQLARGSKTNIVLFDASRDNPSAGQSAGDVLGMSPAEDLEKMQILMAFSTGPGAVALHGPGRNSPFTSALLKHLAEKGRSLMDVMRSVSEDVRAATGGEQSPWINASLSDDVFLAPAGQQ
jgi:uncharacterized caspase-like protein